MICVTMEKQCSITEIRINSLGDLIDAATPSEPDVKTGRRRDVGIYRGMCDPDWPLLTSLDQLGGVNPPHTKADVEEHVLRNFIRYSRPHLTSASVNQWELLVLAQHHGLPTRLLDWTHSPLVALHFVTSDLRQFDRDGVVWMVDYVRAQAETPAPLRAELDEASMNVFTAESLGRVTSSLRELEELGGDFVLFLEPPALNQRIVNQYALFSLTSRADRRLDEWLEQRPGLARRVVVPAELKWEVRDKLDQANVTERVLFPGLDGLSRWLARYYRPRSGA